MSRDYRTETTFGYSNGDFNRIATVTATRMQSIVPIATARVTAITPTTSRTLAVHAMSLRSAPPASTARYLKLRIINALPAH